MMRVMMLVMARAKDNKLSPLFRLCTYFISLVTLFLRLFV